MHYFTEWIRDNSEKGLVEDVTREIGGIRIEKPLNFMGTHPGSYPALDSNANLGKIRRIEDSLSSIPYYYLPQDSLSTREHLIEEGDIIALSTDISGLDVTHTGIAVRMSDGRIHLLHASTRGQVMVTAEPLQDYLKKIKRNTGIIVARPLVPEPK